MLSMPMSLEDDVDLSFLRDRCESDYAAWRPLAVDLKKCFEQRFGFTLYENYGISETTLITDQPSWIRFKDGSTGTVLPGVQLQIVDQQLVPLPTGKEGQDPGENAVLHERLPRIRPRRTRRPSCRRSRS